jgi:BASS family bile acid:Na+ symporter
MQYSLSAAVFLLMVSIGMSLRLSEVTAKWRTFTWVAWLRLLLATFIVPPAAALLIARILPLNLGETAGLFMVGATPGAPLLTRNLARRGFDMHLAAGYQVWGAVLTPVMIPLIVFGAAKLYDRHIWIPPRVILWQLTEKEFLPLLVGVALIRFAPAFSRKAQPKMNIIGNVTLTLVLVLMLWKMGRALMTITPWVVLATLLLLVVSVACIHFLLRVDAVTVRTLAVSNANRHVGLALLLSGRYVQAGYALPVVACYALSVAVMMVVAPRIFRVRDIAESVPGAR